MIPSIRTRVASLLTLTFLLAHSALGQEEHKFEHTLISGNRIAWSCEGGASPTIVLIAGGGLDAHNSFGRVYHNYGGSGRICMYDRAGMGSSDFAQPHTRSLKDLVSELHKLVEHEAWGNVVLVAHSFGGFIARAYASEYPDEVQGILFLDAAQED